MYTARSIVDTRSNYVNDCGRVSATSPLRICGAHHDCWMSRSISSRSI